MDSYRKGQKERQRHEREKAGSLAALGMTNRKAKATAKEEADSRRE
jgi:hypothetical protein